MAAPTSAYKDRHFLAVIGDEVCSESSVGGLYIQSVDLGLCDWSTTCRHWGKYL